jgi:hypothetical protein
MNAGQMAAMAEATRLTRQGRLAEATALIQQALAGPPASRRPPDAPGAGEEITGTPGRDPSQAGAARRRRDTTGGGPFRLASPPPRSAQLGPFGSPPPAPARVPGRAATAGPV